MRQPTTNSRTWTRWKKLNWTSSPSRRLPHGVTGLLAVLVGLKIILDSVRGNVYQYEYHANNWMASIPAPIVTFVGLTLLNAISGYQLARIAQKEHQIIFRHCAVFQMCLCYFCVRFLPHFTVAWYYLLHHDSSVAADDDTDSGGRTKLLEHALRDVDGVITGIALFSTFSFWKEAIGTQSSIAIAIAITGGTMGILLLSVYPVQLVLRGQDWYECVQTRYSHQASGMVQYIYIPASVTFSLVLFGATLFARGIVSSTVFGVASLVVVIVCLVGTVLTQEVHIPDISTQRIFLPCVEPEAGTMEQRIVEALDFSLYARAFLAAVFHIKFEAQ